MTDLRSRKWLITINNPLDKGFTHEKIIAVLGSFSNLSYYCLSDEIGEKGTPHTHIFLYSSNAIRQTTLKNKFNGAHFDLCKGTCQENRDYVFKIGKWKDNEKNSTNLTDTHIEWGELPIERQGARNDLADLYDMILSGMSNAEIIATCPQYLLNIDKLDKVRITILEDKYKSIWRDLYVEYIYGLTGTGKTRSIMEQYGYENVYRVTDYAHPFDSYNGQEIIVFEEFRSSLKIEDMLKYLDGYPCYLPARYSNRVACYTKVYIITNIDLCEQYSNIQKEQPETWKAFLRRIHNVTIFTNNSNTTNTTINHMNGFRPYIDDDNPF